MPRSRRPARPRRAHLSVHALEPRDVPAAEIRASLVKGVLTLTGNDFANSVTVTLGGGSTPKVLLTSTDSTIVTADNVPHSPNTQVVLAGAVTSVGANLNGGDDSFAIDGTADFVLAGPLFIDLGDGNNSLSLDTDGKLSLGDLTVGAGDGKDTAVVRGRETGSGMPTGRKSTSPATIDLGDGGYDVTVQNFTVPGSAGMRFTAGDGDGTFVAAGIDLDNDTAPDTVGLQLGDTPPDGKPFTGGGAFVGTTGNGTCSYSFGATNLGSFSASTGTGGGRVSATFGLSRVTGGVRLTGGETVALTAGGTDIGGSVGVVKKASWASFKDPTGRQASADIIGGSVGGRIDVTASGGSSAARLSLEGAGPGQPLAVGGLVNVTDDGSNGTAAMSAEEVTIGGAVSVQATGTGHAAATADWTGSSVTRAITVRGTDRAAMTVTGNLIAGRFNPAVEMVEPTDDVTVSARNGASRLTLTGDHGSQTLSAADVTVSGTASAGIDLHVGAALGAVGDLAVTSQQDASLVDVDRDGITEASGQVTVSGPDAATLIAGPSWFADSATSPVAVLSRWGTATAAFGQYVSLDGGLAVSGGHAADVTLAPPVQDIAGNTTIGGKVQVSAGPGGARVDFENLNFHSPVGVSVLGGDSTVTFKNTVVAPTSIGSAPSLGISTGGGADAVTLDRVTVSGPTNISSGGGRDTLTIDGSEFKNQFAADLGAGDDRVLLAQAAAAAAPVLFDSAASILAGAGNDTLKAGVAAGTPGAGANTLVVFHSPTTKVNGGPGLNLFDDEAGQFAVPPRTTAFLNWTDPTPD